MTAVRRKKTQGPRPTEPKHEPPKDVSPLIPMLGAFAAFIVIAGLLAPEGERMRVIAAVIAWFRD